MNSSSGISDLRADFARDFEHLAQRGAGLQRAIGAALDHGTVGDGIGERHAQLDQVRAAALERRHQAGCAVGRGIAGGDVGDQALAAFVAQPFEQCG